MNTDLKKSGSAAWKGFEWKLIPFKGFHGCLPKNSPK